MIMPLLALVAASYGNLSMREVGPAVAGGRLAAVAGTPQNDKLYYVGSAGGGVWKSENGGATWMPVFDNQHVSAIGAVTIDPRNQNVVWVGTGEANPRNDVSYGDGVYKTTDGGKHWTRVGLAGVWSISRIAVDPRNPQHVVVAAFGDPFKDSTDRGVYVTFDGGKTFAKTLYVDARTGASDLAMNPQDPSVVYAGMWPFRREPWTFTSGGPDGGLYKSTDGGKNWTKLTGNGLPAGEHGPYRSRARAEPSETRLCGDRSQGRHLVALRRRRAHWKMVSNDTLVDQRPFYFSHIAVDPSNPNHVYAVSEMLAESKDGGKKFDEIAKGVHVDYHAMWIAPNNPKRIMIGEDGGFGLTLDGGKTLVVFAESDDRRRSITSALGRRESRTQSASRYRTTKRLLRPVELARTTGLSTSDWIDVVGGDGEWTIPIRPIRATFGRISKTACSASSIAKHRPESLGSAVRRVSGQFLGPFDSTRCNVSLQLGFAARVRAVGRRTRHGSAATSFSIDRSRQPLDADQPGSHPQHQGSSEAGGRTAGEGRFRRGVFRHAALYRRLADR